METGEIIMSEGRKQARGYQMNIEKESDAEIKGGGNLEQEQEERTRK